MNPNNFIVSTSHLQPIHKANPISDISFIYCLVGNIVEELFSKSEQKIFKGTKHFSSGTKVYCVPPLWGDGYENIKVIGRHRNSTRMVAMIIPSKHGSWELSHLEEPIKKNGTLPIFLKERLYMNTFKEAMYIFRQYIRAFHSRKMQAFVIRTPPVGITQRS
jgi:hypothetical protein